MISKALNTTKSFLLHFLFWVGVWFFFVYFFSYNSNDTNYITWFSSLLLPIAIIATYCTIYILIPKYLLTKQYFKFGLYGFYSLVLSTYLIVLAIYGSFIFITNLNISEVPPMGRNFIFIFILVYLVVGLVSFIYILKHNFNDRDKLKALENKILETNLQIKEQELQYLKKQIHPHFLFNTLNTIYAFALKKSEYTPEIILKLSNLLDYILYQVQKPKVLLVDEIEHIKEYIDLEKIRFGDRLKVTFKTNNIPGDIEIPPMLFISFIENAFKHGSIVEGFLSVDVNLNIIEENQLEFIVKNSYIENSDSSSEGIGLKNITKRLDLLYGKHYKLYNSINNHCFTIALILTKLSKQDEQSI